MLGFVARHPFATALLGMALLTGMDALVKALSAGFPTFEIVFLRFALTAVLVGALALATRQRWPERARLGAHLGRAALTVVTTSSFFYALGHLPLAEVFALSFTSPIFTAVLAAVFLREPLSPRILGAIALGFLGMLVIVFADGSGAGVSLHHPPFALACVLASPVTYAFSIVLLRAQTARESITVIVAVQSAMVAALLAPVMVTQFVWPGAVEWRLFLLVGLLGAAGYLAFASGLKHMAAARFSLVEYTGLLWAALFGYVFFAEVPRVSVWIGAGLIIAGCLSVVTARAEDATRTPPTASPE